MAEWLFELDADAGIWRNATTAESSTPAGTQWSDCLHNNSNRIAYTELIETQGDAITFECAEGFYLFAVGFDADGGYLGPKNGVGYSGGWKLPPYTVDLPNAEYVGLIVRKATNGAIRPSEAADVRVCAFVSDGGGWLRG